MIQGVIQGFAIAESADSMVPLSIGWDRPTTWQTEADYEACCILMELENHVTMREFEQPYCYFLAMRMLLNARFHLRHDTPYQPGAVKELLDRMGG